MREALRFFVTWCLFLYLYVDEGTNERMKGRRGRGCWLVCGFVGGWLLGRRKSAKSVFKKSELAACCRSDSGLLKTTQIPAVQESAPLLQKQSQTASPSAAGVSSEKKCRLTIGCGSSALRWTTARAEFAPVCRESLGIGAALDA